MSFKSDRIKKKHIDDVIARIEHHGNRMNLAVPTNQKKDDNDESAKKLQERIRALRTTGADKKGKVYKIKKSKLPMAAKEGEGYD